MYSNPLKKLTKVEWCLWIGSMLVMIVSFLFVKEKDYLNLVTSLLGATLLIFLSKGDILGHILGIIFAILYGIISYSFRYYGEMITYLLMTLPMSVFSLISWFKNPYKGSRNQVEVGQMNAKKWILSTILTIIVTTIMYFILKALDTPNLYISTLSVVTSFFAAMLTLYRSPYYGIAFALNDLVLITLWTLASIENSTYIPVAINFAIFFINDLYGFMNWRRILKKQIKDAQNKQ